MSREYLDNKKTQIIFIFSHDFQLAISEHESSQNKLFYFLL